MQLDPPCGAGAGLEVLFLEALEDLMGEPRPCWLYPSSFQSPGLALAAAAAAGIACLVPLCIVLGWVGKESRQAHLIRKTGPGELGLKGEKIQAPPRFRHCPFTGIGVHTLECKRQ